MFGKVFRNITVDNGVGFADYKDMEDPCLERESVPFLSIAARIAVGNVAQTKTTTGLSAGIYKREKILTINGMRR